MRRVNAAATSALEELAALKALADPTRLRLLELLAAGERCVCDLHTPLGLAQNLTSHHLRVLREAGLVRARKSSRWSYYTLERERLAQVLSALGALLEIPEAGEVASSACCEP